MRSEIVFSLMKIFMKKETTTTGIKRVLLTDGDERLVISTIENLMTIPLN